MGVKLSLPQLNCERCGHTWFPRSAHWPKRCAHCRSPYWDKPKKEPRAK